MKYLAKFLPHISEVMSPIRHLTKTDVLGTWSQAHEEASDKVKKMVSEAPVLRYDDNTKTLLIQFDASEKGLEPALL